MKPVVAPLTQQIVLKGIITKGNLSENLAVIEDLLTRKEDLYKVGEIIRDAQITSISQNKVSFLYHNKTESLPFFEPEKSFGKAVVLSSSGVVRKSPIVKEGLGKQTVTPAPKNLNLAKAMKNFKTNSELYSEISIAPVINGEKRVNGYMIANIPERSLVEMMGFKDNDVITHVNGTLINSPQKAFEIYRSIAEKGSTVKVEVLRNGRPNVLSFRLQ
ncbi:unnamed protein product [marine sediment metagenome]|uniref:PDZ domain-containing protein n=1 Tax=marine sediment metagenome TaxID=412755 RepID=X1BK48_9ZZZZ